MRPSPRCHPRSLPGGYNLYPEGKNLARGTAGVQIFTYGLIWPSEVLYGRNVLRRKGFLNFAMARNGRLRAVVLP